MVRTLNIKKVAEEIYEVLIKNDVPFGFIEPTFKLVHQYADCTLLKSTKEAEMLKQLKSMIENLEKK